LILLLGSTMVVYNAVERILNPVKIHYNGMILFAIVGTCVNFCAALFTRDGDSLNQKAVNLHMLEDVLGWLVVLIGGVVMRFTDFYLLDPIMSIGVAIFIFINAVKTAKEGLEIFLEKAPRGVDVHEIKEHICQIEGVLDVHHVHIWSMDGHHHYATMHVVAKGNSHNIKESVRAELQEHGIGHVTIEIEEEGELCRERTCRVEFTPSGHHHHHHHHHG
jgi:cobalt-zinc-cadmium efflux system protein